MSGEGKGGKGEGNSRSISGIGEKCVRDDVWREKGGEGVGGE